VRSNTFVDRPWQLREFKTDINAKGEAVFVADSVKSNPLAELFAKEGNQDSDSRICFAHVSYFSPKICDCSTAFFAFTRFRIRVFSLKT
jgi:hypothetical protein